MSVLLFLNELSCPAPASRQSADDAMEGFVLLLRHIARWRRDSVLVSDVKREELELAPGYYLQEWAGAPRHRDLWRFIRGMQNRAPFGVVIPRGMAEEVEYLWHGQVAKAVMAAHLLDGLLISLLIDDCWDVSTVHATRMFSEEMPDGNVDICQELVDVRHAAKLEHTETHEAWIKSAGVPYFRRGEELWAAREDLYPDLRFLPRVEDDLHRLKPEWVIPVAGELRRINDAIADWEPSKRPRPTWRSYVTPEHEMRRLLCRFVDLDGQERIFDLHARFTPGEGRIHLRLVPEVRSATVAYIGLKRGI